MKRFLTLVWILFSTSLFAKSKQEKYKLEQINTLIQPLPHHQIFYHWTRPNKAKRLVSLGYLSIPRFQVTMHVGTKLDNLTLHAGRGMYISERYDNCSKYGDTLIEVHAVAGTPYLDLTHPQTKKNMQRLNIKRRDVFTLNPNALIRFDETHQWWVIKTREGISFANFHEPDVFRLLRSYRKFVKKGDTPENYSQILPILRRNVVTQREGIRKLTEQEAQPSLQPSPPQSLYLWRADASCGWYTKNYHLVQDDISDDFCRDQRQPTYSWHKGNCRETVRGYPQIIIKESVDSRHCPIRFRHKGRCAKLRGNEIRYIKESYCQNAGL
ncbi:MAG: hypothetical protein AB8C84_05950 [Oligoflexales bacterium]